MKLDPITLEILNNKVTSVAEEAGYTIQRTGRTLYVKETADFGAALANLEGKFFAYPSAIGVSGFIDLDCGPTIRAAGDLEPGDVIMTNHPYLSEGLATHIPDLHLVVPYFYENRLVCFGWSFLHSSYMGGRVPGSISPSNSEMFQEGLLIPPMKLCIRGELNKHLVALIQSNSRTPDEQLSDLQAMLAAHNVAQRRVVEVIGQHGLEIFMQAQQDLIEYAATKSREVLRNLPDGSYDFWDYMDDDLVSSVPLRIRVRMTVRDGLVELDFTGTDPQSIAAFNVPTSGKRHAWLTTRLMGFICTHDASIPMNSGIFENISVVAPKGTLVHPEWPGAVGVRHATAIRINDVLSGAILQAAPKLMPASSGGVVIPIVMAESINSTGEQKVLVVEPMVGGMGARLGCDGVDGRDSGISNLSNNPIESVESSANLVVRRFGLRADSGGAGKWRGGVGLELTFEVLNDGVRVLGRGMERFVFQPWGFDGGHPAVKARTVVNIGRSDQRDVGKIDMVTLKAGDTLTVLTPGGGGFGDPWERDPSAVGDDVLRGLVSVREAREAYGVVITNDTIDESQTQLHRKSRESLEGKERQRGKFRFGSARCVWDSIFDDESMVRFTSFLLGLPLARRQQLRHIIYAEVLGDYFGRDASIEDLAPNTDFLAKRFRSAVARICNSSTSAH